MDLNIINFVTTVLLSIITIILVPILKYAIQIEKRVTVLETKDAVRNENKKMAH